MHKLNILVFIALVGTSMSSIMEFNYILKHIVKKNPGIFVGYGNYCGEGAIGGDPVDKIDECCKDHDDCYWKWEDKYKEDSLDIEFKYEFKGDDVLCNDPKEMLQELCECDVVMAKCALKHIDILDEKNYKRMIWERFGVIMANAITGKSHKEKEEYFINN